MHIIGVQNGLEFHFNKSKTEQKIILKANRYLGSTLLIKNYKNYLGGNVSSFSPQILHTAYFLTTTQNFYKCGTNMKVHTIILAIVLQFNNVLALAVILLAWDRMFVLLSGNMHKKDSRLQQKSYSMKLPNYALPHFVPTYLATYQADTAEHLLGRLTMATKMQNH